MPGLDLDALLNTSATEEDKSLKQKSVESAQRFIHSHGNYLVVVLLAVLSLFTSFLSVEGGAISFAFPEHDNWLTWAVYIVMLFVPIVIGFLIKDSLRKQGIYMALNTPTLSTLQDEYDGLLDKDQFKPGKEPRSLGAWKKTTRKRELAINIGLGLITSAINGVALSASVGSIVKTLTNFLMWGIFGIIDLFAANDFAMTEYKQYLKMAIKSLRNSKN